MLNNYFTIKETAKYLNEFISGFIIKDIYTQEKNKLLIEVFNDEKDLVKILEYSIEKDFNYLLIKDHYSKAKKNVAGLFEETYNKIISAVKLFNDDRAISFLLDDDIEIVFTFFSNKANCFLIHGGIVINSFKDKDEYSQKNVQEVIPVGKKASGELLQGLAVDKYVKQNYRRYGDLYAAEVLYGNIISGKDAASEEIINKIKEAFTEINIELSKPEFLLYTNNKSFHMSLIRLNHLTDYSVSIFDNINDLISEFIKYKFRIDKTDVLKQNRLSELSNKIAQIEKKIKGVQTQLQHCEDSENIKRSGDIILQNIYLINKGDKVFHYTSEDDSEITVKLKEELTPSENAKFYFEKYKKQKGSVDLLKEKIDVFIKEKTKLESELKRINDMTEYKTLLKEEKKSEEIKNDETSKFRKFRLNDKYEVWVGKDSASNDLLTTKYAAQNDLWFHVRGASGSHTVLKVSNKKEDVEKESIIRAASIAAYYSKARNASNVPVAYCEKKYVKKKKGFKSGTVIMEREKVIFVKPALPINNEQ